MESKIKVGSDFSGVGAFNQALQKLGIEYREIFACDMDKYARQTFIHNYGEPEYYPTNVYDREIPKDSLDIYMTSPPCQAFSLAGKRLGKGDKRGILFFNSLEFIQVNRPRYFIFENVKGLLSDDGGRTFSEWVNLLGGKSVNGVPVIFPYEDAVPYHLYWKVLNAKHHGVPQNRERVFLVGIRDDKDNSFTWPVEEQLKTKLKDVLEDNVSEKYFLSDKMIKNIVTPSSGDWKSGKMTFNTEIAKTLNSRCAKMGRADTDNYIKVKSATSKGYEEATEGDSINLSVPNSETRRGRVGKGVAQTLDTSCNQGVMIGAFRGRNPENPLDRTVGSPTQQMLEINKEGVSNTITTVQKDNVVVFGEQVTQTLDTSCNQGVIVPLFQWGQGSRDGRWVYDKNGISPCMVTAMGSGGGVTPSVIENYKIRRLTPRECFRLMDFPDTFTWPVSDSQAYKQAGNSIVVRVLAKIIERLKL